MTSVENYNRSRVAERGIDEFIGLCKGLIADDRINGKEANFILNWLENNPLVRDAYPADQVYPKLRDMFSDGVWSPEEEQKLIGIVRALTGEQGQCGSMNMSTELPFDPEPPRLTFSGETFCLTGEFAFGPRQQVQAFIQRLGGHVADHVLRDSCILVVGCKGNDSWIHATFGRKIEDALKLREKGASVHIVSEQYWSEEAVRVEREQKEQEKETTGLALHAGKLKPANRKEAVSGAKDEAVLPEPERSLRLLEELTTKFVDKRVIRGKVLLPTPEHDVEFGYQFTSIGQGWAFRIEKTHFDCLDTQLTERVFKEHVLMPKEKVREAVEKKEVTVPETFELVPEPGMSEVVISRKRLEWTQGSTFHVEQGYTFYGNDEKHPVCIQVREATPSTAPVAVNKKSNTPPPDAEKLIQDARKAGGSGELIETPDQKERYVLQLRYPREPGKAVFAVYHRGTDREWEQTEVINTTMDEFIRVLISGV